MHLLAPSLCLSVTSTWARSSTRHTYAYLARNHLKLARSITEPRNGNIEQLQTSTSARVQNARRKPTLCDHDYSAQLHSQVPSPPSHVTTTRPPQNWSSMHLPLGEKGVDTESALEYSMDSVIYGGESVCVLFNNKLRAWRWLERIEYTSSGTIDIRSYRRNSNGSRKNLHNRIDGRTLVG